MEGFYYPQLNYDSSTSISSSSSSSIATDAFESHQQVGGGGLSTVYFNSIPLTVTTGIVESAATTADYHNLSTAVCAGSPPGGRADVEYSPSFNSSSTPKLFNSPYSSTDDFIIYQTYSIEANNNYTDSAYQTNLDYSSQQNKISMTSNSSHSMTTSSTSSNNQWEVSYSENQQHQQHQCQQIKQEEKETDTGDDKSLINEILNNCYDLVEVKSSRRRLKKPRLTRIEKMRSSGQESFDCKDCMQDFSSLAKYLMHKHKVHANGSSTQCPICFKKFGSQANTLVHMRAHTQEKSYGCKYCEQSFCDSSTLKKHLRTHTGERPYECGICQRQFSQSGNLKRHLEVHRKHERSEYVAPNSSTLPHHDVPLASQVDENLTTQAHQQTEMAANQMEDEIIMPPVNIMVDNDGVLTFGDYLVDNILY